MALMHVSKGNEDVDGNGDVHVSLSTGILCLYCKYKSVCVS